MTTIKFGTDGWRSLVAEDFILPNVRVVTQGIAEYLIKHPAPGRPRQVIVGFDTRPLGDRFAQAVAEVFAGNGFQVLLTETPMPTPAISFAIQEFRLAGGIVVTASHNPFTYNGIKFKPFYAGPSEPEMTHWIEKRLFKHPVKKLALQEGVSKGRIQTIDLTPRYFSFLRGYVKWPLIRSRSFRVAYDSMHGAGQNLLQHLTQGSRLNILPVGGTNGPVPSAHRPEPVGEHLKELMAFVRKHRCDVGLATDGDADRLGVVDNQGHFVSSQETMALLVWHLLEDRGWRGMVVTTVSGTNLMEAITSAYRVPFKRTPVGFKHIARLMRTRDVLFGGEESGGFGFRGCVPERDGLLAGLLVLEMMAMRRASLVSLVKQMRKKFGTWMFERTDLTLSRPLPAEELLRWAKKMSPAVLKSRFGIRAREIQTVDGVKVTLQDQSWFLLRPSGTEPLLRIYAEAKNSKALHTLLAVGQRVGRAILG